MLNLDTHIVVYALTGELTNEERRLLRSDSWSVSAIVLWELAKLAQLNRIEVDMESADFTRLFSRIHVWPLDLATCRQSVNLDFRSDPADEIIAATSIIRNAPLLTRDRRMLASKIIPFAERRSHPRSR
jgi:PIN domain nuclease of toxin-antitoxin system